MAKKQPLDVVVEVLGSQAELARQLGIKPPTVSQWFTEKRPVPPRFCIPIEQATSGAVTRYDLRPDVFGEPTQVA